MCQVKVRSKVTMKASHFGLSGWLDGLQRAHTQPKCLVNVHEGNCMSTKGIHKKVKIKVRSQKVTIKQRSQTCHTTYVFWAILHSDIDGHSHLTLRRHSIWPLMEGRSGHKGEVRSQRVTIKRRTQTGHTTCVFWAILHADIDGDSHLTLWRQVTKGYYKTKDTNR